VTDTTKSVVLDRELEEEKEPSESAARSASVAEQGRPF
jgi:hypothetical protein